MDIIGVGIDIEDVERLKTLLDKGGDRSIHRVFTDNEIEYCNKKVHPFLHLTARFSAKEAILKSMSVGRNDGLMLTDIEITNSKDGVPSCTLKGEALKIMEERGGKGFKISISHTDDRAVSYAVCYK